MFGKIKYISILVLLGFSVIVSAQTVRPKIEAKLAPDSIGIGDRFTITVDVEKDATQVVEFPFFKDGKLDNGMEIVGETAIDTLSREGRIMRLQKAYTMTVFDEGTYNIGKFPVLYFDKNIIDTLYSSGDSLLIQVGTFEIDTLTQTIYDIKRPMDLPVKVGEYLGYVIAGLVFMALVVLGVYLAIQSRRGNNRLFSWKPKHVDPPHIVAIKELQSVYDQKLWQSGKHKQYYTRITDILREYIQERFSIHAMEMTSDEIINALADNELSDKSRKDLSNLLKVADLVKFAKYLPDADDNESSYNGAYYFVENTKPEESEEKPEMLNIMEDEQ